MNFCTYEGYLVSASTSVPTDACDYHVEALPRVGCSRLRCRRCNQAVRQRPKLRFRDEDARVDLKPVYALVDLASSPLLQSAYDTRLYLCQCASWTERSYRAIGDPDPTPADVTNVPWRCEGHPIVKLPHDFDGELIKDEGGLVDLVVYALNGVTPAQARPEDRPRALYAARLYTRLQKARLDKVVLADVVVATISDCLTDTQPQVRARALNFFFALDLAAPRVVDLLEGDRKLFAGVADEITPIAHDKTLEDTLFRVLTPMIVQQGRARDIARAEALAAGKGRRALYDALAASDTNWLVAHADTVARATPNLGEELIKSCSHRFPQGVSARPVAEKIRATLGKKG